nr:hypothetical protein [uncultured Desulfobacter sp.]
MNKKKADQPLEMVDGHYAGTENIPPRFVRIELFPDQAVLRELSGIVERHIQLSDLKKIKVTAAYSASDFASISFHKAGFIDSIGEALTHVSINQCN